jgi:hypothetical protein
MRTLLACASNPSASANRIMSSALAANFFASYSMMLVDFIKSFALNALKNLALVPVGSVRSEEHTSELQSHHD